MKINCCRHCEERTARCHTYCKRYKEERAKLDAERERQHDIKSYEDEQVAYRMNSNAKWRQARRRWRRKT